MIDFTRRLVIAVSRKAPRFGATTGGAMQTIQARRHNPETPRFEAAVASTWSLVAQSQRLRARMTEGTNLFDEDRFDAHCEHLARPPGAPPRRS